jgi:Transposase
MQSPGGARGVQEAELDGNVDSENNHGRSSIGLDVLKKTISYCVEDATGQVHREGQIGATRWELDGWMKTLPQPWTVAMEATIFTGWIYDHLLPHAPQVKVAHPLMLRAIAAAKKKIDRIDAGKIADCLRCDFLPECHMASRDSGSTPHPALPAPAGAPDGADEEPDLRSTHGNGSASRQAAAAQSGLFPRTAGQQRRSE